MTNEDYGSVRINWDYFGEVLREKKNSAGKPINKYIDTKPSKVLFSLTETKE